MDVLHLFPEIAHVAADEIEISRLPDRSSHSPCFYKFQGKLTLKIAQYVYEGAGARLQQQVDVRWHHDETKQKEAADTADSSEDSQEMGSLFG